MPPNNLYATLLLLATLASGVVALVAWHRRRVAGAAALVLMALAMVCWSGTYALHWTRLWRPTHFFWLDLTYGGVVWVPVCLWVFAVQYTGHQSWLSRSVVGSLVAWATLTLVILFTDPWHGLFFGGLREPTAGSIFAGGPWFWANAIYSYALFLWAIILLALSHRRRPGLFRVQTRILLSGMLIPWVLNVVSLVGLNPWPDLDLSPVAFTLSGLILSIGLFRYRWLDIVPVARDRLIESMSDGVLVLDHRDRIVDLNPMGRRLLALQGGDPIGQAITAVGGRWAELVAQEGAGELEFEITLESDPAREFELRVIPLQGPVASQGRLVILRDISARRGLEREREQMILSLRDALGQVRTLEGLLPICSNCKRIRDQNGEWERIELYIKRHSDADFTHGICPDCMHELYPDLGLP